MVIIRGQTGVIAIIIQAFWSLGSKAIKSIPTSLAAAAVIGLYFLGINEIVLLFSGGLVVMLVSNLQRLRGRMVGVILFPLVNAVVTPIVTAIPFSLPTLFLTFLKIGAVALLDRLT